MFIIYLSICCTKIFHIFMLQYTIILYFLLDCKLIITLEK